MSDRQEIEARLLGCLFVDPEVWYHIATDFDSKYFSTPEYKTIATILQEQSTNGSLPSSVRVYRELRKQAVDADIKALVNPLNGFVSSKEVISLLDDLKDMWKRRLVHTTLSNTLQEIQDMDLDTDQLLAKAQQGMFSAFGQATGGGVATMHDVSERLMEQQVQIQTRGTPSFTPWNAPAIQTLAKGVEEGSLVIIAGRPSMGKTAYAIWEAAMWAKKGIECLVFSLEQTDLQIGQRIMACLAQIEVNAMRHAMRGETLDSFHTGLTTLQDLAMHICDRRGLSVEQICSLARLHKAKHPGTKCIVIDYLQIISTKGKNRVHEIGEITLQLRNLAKELGVWVLLLSQLSRGLESRDDKRPVKSDLRDSGNIEEHADMIIFLYRHGYYYPNFCGQEEGDWITEILLAKNRQAGGDGQSTVVVFEKPFMRWRSIGKDWLEIYKQSLQKKK